MGFFNKVWNFLSKGQYRETAEIEAEKQAREQELLRREAEKLERNEAAERQQYEEKSKAYGADSTLEDNEKIRELAREAKKEKELEEIERKQTERDLQRAEVREAERGMAKKPLKKEMEEKLDDTTVNTIPIQTTLSNLNDLRPIYEQAFAGNGKLTDPDILDALIAGRAHLKHRFTAHVQVFDEQGVAGEIEIAGILPEHAGYAKEFFTVGDTYGAKDFTETDHTESIGTALKRLNEAYENNFGAHGGSPVAHRDNETIRIVDIRVNVTFA